MTDDEMAAILARPSFFLAGKSETDPDYLRAYYRACKTGAQKVDAVDVHNMVDYLANRECAAKALAAFAALGMEKLVTCTHCKGSGISRGSDRGMGCGYCHGRCTITESHAARLSEHRRAVSKKYGYSRV